MSDKYHFIGIGGIGMSGLAHIALQKGYEVSGSDMHTDKEILRLLQKKGARIFQGHDPQNIPSDACVVYSSAIDSNNPELQEAKKNRSHFLHRSDFLVAQMEHSLPLLVAGTHGKTTTASLLTHVLLTDHQDPSYALGGIGKNFSVNAHWGKGRYFVAETDESDGSFTKGKGVGGIITNMDNDHLNYWKDFDALKRGFRQFAEQIKEKSLLFWCEDDPLLKSLDLEGVSYGFSTSADLRILKMKRQKKGMVFTLSFEKETYADIFLPLWGEYNVLNAAAVFGLAVRLGIKEDTVREAFINFLGIKRRQDLIGETGGVLFYHDYGHHPTAIRKTLEAFAERHGDKRILVLFEPHRYTRMRDAWEDIPSAFVKADFVVVTDIYSAGEPPIESITSQEICRRIQEKTKATHIPKDHLESFFSSLLRPHDLVIAFGAGESEKMCAHIFASYCQHPNRLKMALVFGGQSCEHDISIMSAQNVNTFLDSSLYDVSYFYITRKGMWLEGSEAQELLNDPKIIPSQEKSFSSKLLEMDCCFPILHGPHGEDGIIQGFLDMLHLPYVGCNSFSSAICMDKAWSKRMVESHGILCGSYIDFSHVEWLQEKDVWHQKMRELCLPLFIKAVHLGSSVGVFCAFSYEEAEQKIQEVFCYDSKVIIEEQFIGREIEVGVMGYDEIFVSPPGEILSKGEVYGYEEKYGRQGFSVETPAQLSLEQTKVVQHLAKKIYQALGCNGMARVDFFLDDCGRFFFNEINPIPGFTRNSLFPKMFEKGGFSGTELVQFLIAQALKSYRKKECLHV
ncbi:MAG: UDP-N-acetylmuramate--L-alanine ligase [Parachlamydiales bacterium]|nr:UDP-N-acetylmuramate--L-alanine ligase [Parachlamydiales bacterium]